MKPATRRKRPVDYLANYEKDIQSEDVKRRVLHHGTHPPGLFLCYRGLIKLCESSPGLVKAVLKTQPPSVSAMFDEIERGSRRTRQTSPRQRPGGDLADDALHASLWCFGGCALVFSRSTNRLKARRLDRRRLLAAGPGSRRLFAQVGRAVCFVRQFVSGDVALRLATAMSFEVLAGGGSVLGGHAVQPGDAAGGFARGARGDLGCALCF